MREENKSFAVRLMLGIALALVLLAPAGMARAASLDLYLLGAGDILEITVWREDALSREEVLVRPDGRISMPLVDDIMAEGRTPMQLKATITKELLKYVEAPKVYVTVREPRSHSYSVVGHVTGPGTYPMFRATSILQALAEAKSFDEWASRDEIRVVRGFGADTKILLFNYDKFMNGDEEDRKKAEAQNIILQPGDIVIVP